LPPPRRRSSSVRPSHPSAEALGSHLRCTHWAAGRRGCPCSQPERPPPPPEEHSSWGPGVPEVDEPPYPVITSRDALPRRVPGHSARSFRGFHAERGAGPHDEFSFIAR